MTKNHLRFVALVVTLVTILAKESVAETDERIVEAPQIMVFTTKDPQRPYFFNGNASYAVWIRRSISTADGIKASLVKQIAKSEKADKVAVAWIALGSDPDEIEVAIGANVSLQLAQFVVKACLDSSKVPLVLSVNREERVIGDTRTIYVGGLVTSGKRPMDREKIQALLKPTLQHEEFLRIIEAWPNKPDAGDGK